MPLTKGLASAWWALRIGMGLGPFLAGLDKFFNVLTDWGMYLSPLATKILPIPAEILTPAALNFVAELDRLRRMALHPQVPRQDGAGQRHGDLGSARLVALRERDGARR